VLLVARFRKKGRITSKELEKLYVICKLKKWMERFNGVATKYISNYIKWFKWLQLYLSQRIDIPLILQTAVTI
jgi:hypothetical protein